MAGDISEETPRKIILNAVQVMMNTKTLNISVLSKCIKTNLLKSNSEHEKMANLW